MSIDNLDYHTICKSHGAGFIYVAWHHRIIGIGERRRPFTCHVPFKLLTWSISCWVNGTSRTTTATDAAGAPDPHLLIVPRKLYGALFGNGIGYLENIWRGWNRSGDGRRTPCSSTGIRSEGRRLSSMIAPWRANFNSATAVYLRPQSVAPLVSNLKSEITGERLGSSGK